jgi:tetratricopeptide (TPR) repeat protein
MYQKDYLLRITESAARVIAQVVSGRKIEDYQGILSLIDEQFRQTLGMGLGFVHSVSEETLLSLLTSLGTLDTEKCWLTATLLKAEGDIYSAQGDTDEAYYSYLKSLDLFLIVLLDAHNISNSDDFPEVENLLSELEAYDLPEKTKEMIFRYYEKTGRYARAEDMLFEMLEANPANSDLFASGAAFYERLKKKSSADLAAGNLSRDEVEEGLERLRGMKG